MKYIVFIVLVFSLFMAIGCACITYPLSSNILVVKKFVNHRSPFVSKPSEVAFEAGFWVGIPISVCVAVVSFPISACILSCTHVDEGTGWLIIWGPPAIPVLTTGAVSGTVVGSIMWPLFGWWWPGDEVQQLDAPIEQVIEQPVLGVEKTDMNLQDP